MKSKGTLSLSLSSSRLRSKIVPLGVFLLCTCVGIIAGSYIKYQIGSADAAGENITVANNNQIITTDQGTPTITRASTVIVKDSSATSGYTLSARLSQNTIPNATITIGSASSSMCTLEAPCPLTTIARDLIKTTSSTAVGVSGDTTDWTVTMNIPASTTVGNYILDIEYDEIANILPGLVEGGNMQNATKAQCDALSLGTTLNLKDTRDNKIYKVKKMIDGRCWMIENLAFELNNAQAPAYSPMAQLITNNGTVSVQNQAQYIANTGFNTSSGQTTYLYNWCAALGDISSNCTASINADINQTVISGTVTMGTAVEQQPVTGICPIPFRLPKGGLDAAIAADTANEFVKLDIAMGGTGIGRTNANTYPMFTGTSTANNNWSGTLGGGYRSGLIDRGGYGNWWSSTAHSTTNVYYLGLIQPTIHVVLANFANSKSIGFAVRCIL